MYLLVIPNRIGCYMITGIRAPFSAGEGKPLLIWRMTTHLRWSLLSIVPQTQ